MIIPVDAKTPAIFFAAVPTAPKTAVAREPNRESVAVLFVPKALTIVVPLAIDLAKCCVFPIKLMTRFPAVAITLT